MEIDSILVEVSAPEWGFARMVLCQEDDKYIVWGLLVDGTCTSRTWSRPDILALAYRTLRDWSTEQADELAEFLRDGATEAEWTLAALTVL